MFVDDNLQTEPKSMYLDSANDALLCLCVYQLMHGLLFAFTLLL